MDIRKILEKEQKEIAGILQQAKQAYEKNSKIAGNHKLKCGTSHGISQYYIDGKYVPKTKIELIQAIAETEYLKKFIPSAEKINRQLCSLITLYGKNPLSSIATSICPGKKKLIIPLYEDEEEFVSKWLSEKYDIWEISPDTANTFITLKGETVRSKSEKMIADELYHYGVPYKYEYPLKLYDGTRTTTKRPDFVALNRRERHECVLEHFGLVDNYNYTSANFEKLDLYERNGYLLGKNLLIFHETANCPLNIRVVRDYIENYLL